MQEQAGPLDVLLVPVSGGGGSGEAQVALLIAAELLRQCPQLRVCVVLARDSVLAGQTRVPSVLLPDSPTRSHPQMLQLLRATTPRLVLFDSTCRRAQVALARRLGARCIFLFWRAKSRQRALALGKLRLWQALWQLTPRSSIAAPGWWERCKLRLAGLQVQQVGMVAARPDRAAATALLPADWHGQGWWLLCPGGSYATALFRELADALVAAGQRVVLSVQAEPRSERQQRLLELPRLDNAVLLGLADLAGRCVVNGGGWLMQVIALGQRPLALPLMRDQQQRIQAMAALDLCVAAASERLPQLLQQALALPWPERATQRELAATLHIGNSLEPVTARVLAMLAAPPP